jgi:nucleotidyltransferase AbiEii toxin of type IV toxin-antitoxin system
VIPEPQRTYVLELLKALGPAADDFVVAGAQAMKFVLEKARATKDIDFVLDVVGLRGEKVCIDARLKELGYKVVEGSRNFQFEKPIPNSTESMRIEFMAPEEFKREKDFRVDVENGIHARALTGGSIAVAESSIHELAGNLPDGSAFKGSIRVTKPHALVMLKLLALDDRYRNIRGALEATHDREEARTHAADMIAIVSAQMDHQQFKNDFEQQFQRDAALGIRVLKILDGYFRGTTSPGLLVYEESIVSDKALDRSARQEVAQELERAYKMMLSLLPRKEFYELLAAVDDSCDVERNPRLVDEFLSNLEQTGTEIADKAAVERLPGSAFGGAFARGDTFTINASEALKVLSASEISLVYAQAKVRGTELRNRTELARRFPRALGGKR